jgi:dihydrofolate synthase / folylpolyglutamate synthase
MQVQAIKTHKITPTDQNLLAVLDAYLPGLDDGSVLAITSKIVAICQGRVVPIGTIEKHTLIAQEADYFLPPDRSKYHMTLTITQGLLVPTAGIDESNGDGYYVLWPHSLQDTANGVWAYLRRRFGRERLGVMITDSRTTPLRTGVTGVALAHSGFRALHDYVGTIDCFGRRLRMTQGNVVDALAAAAVLVMGEGNEQTPLAVISDLPFVHFQAREPSAEELQQLRMALEDDIYGPLLMSVPWHKGHQ